MVIEGHLAQGRVNTASFGVDASIAMLRASLHLFAYYLGSSVFGTLAGPAWHVATWPGVVTLAVALLAATGLLALLLRRIPTLLDGQP